MEFPENSLSIGRGSVINGARFFLVHHQTEVVQLNPVCACIHNNLHCNHTEQHKDQITSTQLAKIIIIIIKLN